MTANGQRKLFQTSTGVSVQDNPTWFSAVPEAMKQIGLHDLLNVEFIIY